MKQTQRKRSLARILLGVTLAGGLLVSIGPSRAQAGLLSSVSGNTFPLLGSATTQGYVNFAVFDRSGGTSGDTFGTGFANFDSLLANWTPPNNPPVGSYLYLYQTVNTGGVALSQHSVGVPFSSVIAYGALAGKVFQDAQGAVSSGNPLGDTPALGQQNSPASTGVTPLAGTIIATNASALTPGTLVLGAGSLQANYGAPSFLPVGGVGSLFGYTANLGPSLASTGIIDGGASANGSIYAGITPIPEPSTLVLAALAGVCGLALRIRKLRFQV